MKCKFEHDGDCCNCGSPQYMCKCKPVRLWTDKDGNKRRTTEVVADNVYFGDSKRVSDSDTPPAPDFREVPPEEEGALPFDV